MMATSAGEEEEAGVLLRPRATIVFGQDARFYYAFGNAPPTDLLSAVPDGSERASALLLASGDPRSLLHTVWTARVCGRRGLSEFAATLVDKSPHVLARGILLLKLAAECPSYAAAAEDAFADSVATAWDVFFNGTIGKRTAERLKRALAALCDETKSSDAWAASGSKAATKISFCDEASRVMLHAVFRQWRMAMDGIGPIAALGVEAFKRAWEKTLESRGIKKGAFGRSFGIVGSCRVDRYLENSADYDAEISEWCFGGCRADPFAVCGLPGEEPCMVNPTFFSDTTTAENTLHYASIPFSCFFHAHVWNESPRVAKQAAFNNPRCKLLANCLEQLANWMDAFKPANSPFALDTWLFCGDLQDFSDLCASPPGVSVSSIDDPPRLLKLSNDYAPCGSRLFDVVTSSNVVDCIGLLPLLVGCAPLLRRCGHSLLCMEIFTMDRVASTLREWVRVQLGMPMEAIELALGLRLAYCEESFDPNKHFTLHPPHITSIALEMTEGRRNGFLEWALIIEKRPTAVSLRESPELQGMLFNALLKCANFGGDPQGPKKSMATFSRLCAILVAGSLCETELSPIISRVESYKPSPFDLRLFYQELLAQLFLMKLVPPGSLIDAGVSEVSMAFNDKELRKEQGTPTIHASVLVSGGESMFMDVRLQGNTATFLVPSWIVAATSSNPQARLIVHHTCTSPAFKDSLCGMKIIASADLCKLRIRPVPRRVLGTPLAPRPSTEQSSLGIITKAVWARAGVTFFIALSEQAREALSELSTFQDSSSSLVLSAGKTTMRLSLTGPVLFNAVHIKVSRKEGTLQVLVPRSPHEPFKHSPAHCLWPDLCPRVIGHPDWINSILGLLLGSQERRYLAEHSGPDCRGMTSLKETINALVDHGFELFSKSHWVEMSCQGAEHPPIIIWIDSVRFSPFSDVPFLDVSFCIPNQDQGHILATAMRASSDRVQTVNASKQELPLWREMLDWSCRAWSSPNLQASFPVPTADVRKLFRRCCIAPLFPPDPTTAYVGVAGKKVPEPSFSERMLQEQGKAEAMMKLIFERHPELANIDPLTSPETVRLIQAEMEEEMMKAEGGSSSSSAPQQQQHAASKKCAWCRKPGAKLHCSRCKAACYCNVQCQRADWPTHKLHCKKP